MPYMTGLPAALKARGLKVEVVPGWETRGNPAFNPKGALCHWTAGPAKGDRPSLHICTYGRAATRTAKALAGPLCNVFLTRSGVAIVVAAGRANHAGPGGTHGLVGNSSVFGTEAESTGAGGDWTPEQRHAYPLVNAAYVDLGARPDLIFGHHEWTSRKIDIRDWPMPVMRASVASIIDNKEHDDMYGPNERVEVVGRLDRALTLLEAMHPAIAGMQVALQDPTAGVRKMVADLAGREVEDVDPAALAAALLPVLTDNLEVAVREAVAEVAPDVDVDEDALAAALLRRVVTSPVAA